MTTSKITKWFLKHKALTVILIITLFFLPLIITNTFICLVA